MGSSGGCGSVASRTRSVAEFISSGGKILDDGEVRDVSDLSEEDRASLVEQARVNGSRYLVSTEYPLVPVGDGTHDLDFDHPYLLLCMQPGIPVPAPTVSTRRV